MCVCVSVCVCVCVCVCVSCMGISWSVSTYNSSSNVRGLSCYYKKYHTIKCCATSIVRKKKKDKCHHHQGLPKNLGGVC